MEIDELIQQGQALKKALQERRGSWGTYYVHPDQDAYEKWLMLTKRYINAQYPGDKCVEEFEELSEKTLTPTQQAKMLGILEAMKQLPQVVVGKTEQSNPMVAITNTQTQSQTQSVIVDIVVEALHEELSKKQIRELKEIMQDQGLEAEDKKATLLERIADFGMDTLSGLVANILSNPAVWAMM